MPRVVRPAREGPVVTERRIGMDKARSILGDLAADASRGEIAILTSHGHDIARIVPLQTEDGGTWTGRVPENVLDDLEVVTVMAARIAHGHPQSVSRPDREAWERIRDAFEGERADREDRAHG